MARNAIQRQIYDAIVERGYGPTEQGLTKEQFAARQVAKMLEEILELAETVFIEGKPLSRLLLGDFANETKRIAKKLFDSGELWTKAEIDEREFLKELADSVPLFNAAEALGVYLPGLCRDKALEDIRRGVRNGTTSNTPKG